MWTQGGATCHQSCRKTVQVTLVPCHVQGVHHEREGWWKARQYKDECSAHMDAVPSKPSSFQQHCAQSCSTHCKHRQLSAHRSTAPQAHCRCDATAPPGLPWAPLPQLSTLPLFLQNHVQNHVNPEGHTRPAHEAKMAAWCVAPSTTHPRQHTKRRVTCAEVLFPCCEWSHVHLSVSQLLLGQLFVSQY